MNASANGSMLTGGVEGKTILGARAPKIGEELPHRLDPSGGHLYVGAAAMRECQIKHEVLGGVDIMHLNGALDSYSFPRFESSMALLRGSHRHAIVLDCEQLDYINSAALGALVGFARRARENGGDMKVAALSPKIMKIMCLLGLDKSLHILPDVAQAVACFPAPGMSPAAGKT